MRDSELRKYLIVEIAETAEGLYLGRYVRCRESVKSGAIHLLTLEDGAHSSEQGVADAYELHKSFGFLREGQYVMVEVKPLPILAPKVNKQAVKDTQKILAHARRNKIIP